MFFPIRDNNPTYRTPYVTVGLIVVNCLIFLYTKTLGVHGFEAVIFDFGYTPGLLFTADTQVDLPSWLYLTPFSSMFLHAGWMHLLGNMLFLWIYGNNVEDYFGPIWFIVFYLLSGVAAITLYTAFSPSSVVPLVGASGAIAGVMGAYIVLFPRAEITCLIVFFFIQFVTLPAKIVLGIWFVLQLFMSMTNYSSGGGVAWMAHIGGFTFGWLLLKGLIKIRGTGVTPSGGQRIYKMNWQS